MINLKNIADLPVAESVDNLNLIVNENGSAKQIASSAVGAQADWAETNENSPAFIKNKPGYAQADWEETDESNASYVRNKTHYVERNVLVDILPETTYTLMGMGDMLVASLPSDMNLIANKTYQVHYNGTIYECTTMDLSMEMPGAVFLGNTGLLEGPDNGMPFAILVMPGMGGQLVSPTDSEVTLSISCLEDQYHTLDPNYIKDMYSSERVENVEILPETTLNISSDDNITYLYDFTNPLVAGGTYTVNWNGTEYTCTGALDGNDGYKIILFVDGVFEMAYHPAFKQSRNGHSAELYAMDGSTSITLSIAGSSEKVKKINSKYLDIPSYFVNWIDLTDELDNLRENTPNTYNPVFTGSFSINRKANTTIGTYSHAEGSNATASGNSSHAEGIDTTASGQYSHAEGREAKASGGWSHAEGYQTTASQNGAHAEGANTKATNYSSHAEGGYTTASGNRSHAEGYYTTAGGECAHAEGEHTTASGNYSHAEGELTTASGERSHAEGYSTKASGKNSHAEGYYTTATSAYQHVQGKYNIIETEDATQQGLYAHIVGNGTSSQRSNAHTLDWEGNAWFAGYVEGNAVILPSSTEGSTKRFRITVDDSGVLTATEVVVSAPR